MSTLSSPQQAAIDAIDAATEELRTLLLAIHSKPEMSRHVRGPSISRCGLNIVSLGKASHAAGAP